MLFINGVKWQNESRFDEAITNHISSKKFCNMLIYLGVILGNQETLFKESFYTVYLTEQHLSSFNHPGQFSNFAHHICVFTNSLCIFTILKILSFKFLLSKSKITFIIVFYICG